jgi:hypothetical protein
MTSGDLEAHEFSCDVLLFISPTEINAIFADEVGEDMLGCTRDAVIIKCPRDRLRAGSRRATQALAPSSRTFLAMFEALCREFVDLSQADYRAAMIGGSD